jgi:hypothetical protein
MNTIKPFSGEADAIATGELTVENGPDRFAIYGAANITKDKAWLALAQELKALIDAMVATLEAEKNLPDCIPVAPSRAANNPFN